MTVTLITGANKGLGRETARRLLARGHDVWMGARDPGRGQAAAGDLGGRFVALDVTDDHSVTSAVATIERESGRLDVLVNNAGVLGARTRVAEVAVGELRHVFETNVFGPVRVLQAFAPLLLRSDTPVVVNVSSGMGSFAITSDPARVESSINALAYPSSKSALTMLTSQYAKAYPQMRVNAVDPGYTATDLNGHSGPQTVEQGAEIIVRAACFGRDDPTGAFLEAAGTVPW